MIVFLSHGKAFGITAIAPSRHEAGFCALLKSDGFSAFVYSRFKATAKSPDVLEVKEKSWDFCERGDL